MKRIAKIIFLLLLILPSCESFVTGINEDDITRIKEADLKLTVTAAEINYMGFLEGQAARLAGMWSGYFYGADRQFVGFYNYNVTTNTFDTEWQNVYVYTLKQLRISQQKAVAQNNLSVLGICQVMEASIMGTATALWGDVPYREAVDVETYPNPVYDSQVQTIDNLILLLDDAISNLSANVGKRDGDFLGSGSNAQWINVAHSSKARLLLYKKDYAQALAAAEAGIQIPDNDLVAKHGTTLGTDINLYYDFFEISRQGTLTASNTHLGALLDPNSGDSRNHSKTDEAARLSHYYSGESAETFLPNTAPDGFFYLDSPFPLHSAFETKLIAAECSIRLGDFNAALAKLNEHRAYLSLLYSSGTYIDFTIIDFEVGGIENSNGNKSASEALLVEILEEKWVCLYGQVEGFNEIRRTGNVLGIPVNSGTDFPQRFLYSQNEINGNSSVPNPLPGLYEKITLFK